MTDEILTKINQRIEELEERASDAFSWDSLDDLKMAKALRVAVEEIARVPACDSNSCTTCEAIAEIAKILGVKEGEK